MYDILYCICASRPLATFEQKKYDAVVHAMEKQLMRRPTKTEYTEVKRFMKDGAKLAAIRASKRAASISEKFSEKLETWSCQREHC